MAYIYQIINDINGKIYVGKTELDIEKRFKQHCAESQKSRSEKRPLYSAMKKYGLSHFHIELIEETDNPSEREVYWIKEKGSYHNGYNATLGGDGTKLVNDKEIANLYQEVGIQTKVAEQLGICVDTVRQALKNEGIEIDLYPAKKFGKTVFMYDINNNFICEFPSYGEAGRWLQANGKTSIVAIDKVVGNLSRAVDQKQRQTAFGYIWYSKKKEESL